MLDIVETVVDKELQFGDDAQLVAHSDSQFVAHLLLVLIDVLHQFLSLLTGEYAEVDAAHAEVRTDAAGTDADQHTMHLTGLCLENLTQFLLQKPGYLVLSCCFHYILFLFSFS